MQTIALDAMGGDHAPECAIRGAAKLSLEEGGPDVVLVGDEELAKRLLDESEHEPRRLSFVNAPDMIPMDASPKAALDELPRASVLVAAELVANGDADALVSAGNTGAVILTCSRKFQRIDGVGRCALGAVFPTERRRGERDDPFSLILDAGLTLDVRAEDLVSFAVMGSAYASRISKNPSPRIGLLSNGSEPNKGTRSVVEAHALLQEHKELNFIGNIEGMDIPRGTADIIITDGFTGNIVLKMLEGVASTVKSLGRYAFNQNLRNKMGMALLAPAVRELKQVTDWEQYGGAPVLGFDSICIKAHGRSSERAIRNALKVAGKAVRTDLVAAISEGIRRSAGPS